MGQVLVSLAGIAVVFCVCLYFGAKGERQWKAYAAEHHCVAIGEQAGQAVVGSDGKIGIGFSQTIYRCDGDKLVIR